MRQIPTVRNPYGVEMERRSWFTFSTALQSQGLNAYHCLELNWSLSSKTLEWMVLAACECVMLEKVDKKWVLSGSSDSSSFSIPRHEFSIRVRNTKPYSPVFRNKYDTKGTVYKLCVEKLCCHPIIVCRELNTLLKLGSFAGICFAF